MVPNKTLVLLPACNASIVTHHCHIKRITATQNAAPNVPENINAKAIKNGSLSFG
jgi:hypothetical protein